MFDAVGAGVGEVIVQFVYPKRRPPTLHFLVDKFRRVEEDSGREPYRPLVSMVTVNDSNEGQSSKLTRCSAMVLASRASGCLFGHPNP